MLKEGLDHKNFILNFLRFGIYRAPGEDEVQKGDLAKAIYFRPSLMHDVRRLDHYTFGLLQNAGLAMGRQQASFGYPMHIQTIESDSQDVRIWLTAVKGAKPLKRPEGPFPLVLDKGISIIIPQKSNFTWNGMKLFCTERRWHVENDEYDIPAKTLAHFAQEHIYGAKNATEKCIVQHKDDLELYINPRAVLHDLKSETPVGKDTTLATLAKHGIPIRLFRLRVEPTRTSRRYFAEWSPVTDHSRWLHAPRSIHDKAIILDCLHEEFTVEEMPYVKRFKTEHWRRTLKMPEEALFCTKDSWVLAGKTACMKKPCEASMGSDLQTKARRWMMAARRILRDYSARWPKLVAIVDEQGALNSRYLNLAFEVRSRLQGQNGSDPSIFEVLDMLEENIPKALTVNSKELTMKKARPGEIVAVEGNGLDIFYEKAVCGLSEYYDMLHREANKKNLLLPGGLTSYRGVLRHLSENHHLLLHPSLIAHLEKAIKRRESVRICQDMIRLIKNKQAVHINSIWWRPYEAEYVVNWNSSSQLYFEHVLDKDGRLNGMEPLFCTRAVFDRVWATAKPVPYAPMYGSGAHSLEEASRYVKECAQYVKSRQCKNVRPPEDIESLDRGIRVEPQEPSWLLYKAKPCPTCGLLNGCMHKRQKQ